MKKLCDYSEPDPQVKTEPYGTILAVRPFLTCITLIEHFFIVYARSNVPGTVIVLNRSVLALLIVF
jgi:hypothetical protein